jgi:hypothetical protein
VPLLLPVMSHVFKTVSQPLLHCAGHAGASGPRGASTAASGVPITQ